MKWPKVCAVLGEHGGQEHTVVIVTHLHVNKIETPEGIGLNFTVLCLGGRGEIQAHHQTQVLK